MADGYRTKSIGLLVIGLRPVTRKNHLCGCTRVFNENGRMNGHGQHIPHIPIQISISIIMAMQKEGLMQVFLLPSIHPSRLRPYNPEMKEAVRHERKMAVGRTGRAAGGQPRSPLNASWHESEREREGNDNDFPLHQQEGAAARLSPDRYLAALLAWQ